MLGELIYQSSFCKNFYLINLQNLFKDGEKPEVKVLDANKHIRRELFKLYYLEGTYDLYEKGDA